MTSGSRGHKSVDTAARWFPRYATAFELGVCRLNPSFVEFEKRRCNGQEVLQLSAAAAIVAPVQSSRAACSQSHSTGNSKQEHSLRGKSQGRGQKGRGRGHNKGTITVAMRASKRQKEPSIALIFYKLPVSCALSRQRSSFHVESHFRTVDLPIPPLTLKRRTH